MLLFDVIDTKTISSAILKKVIFTPSESFFLLLLLLLQKYFDYEKLKC